MGWTALSCTDETKADVRALKRDEDESDDAVVRRLLDAHAGTLDSHRDTESDSDSEPALPGGCCECECEFSADDVGAVVERKVDDALTDLRR